MIPVMKVSSQCLFEHAEQLQRQFGRMPVALQLGDQRLLAGYMLPRESDVFLRQG